MRSGHPLPFAVIPAALLISVAVSPAFAEFTLLRTYDGPMAGAEYGRSCIVVGDMDGDGIDEFAIGAPGDATGGAAAGRVFIYRGGNPLPDDPAWVITGAPGERLGHSLARALVDNDQVPDLVIGAPGSSGVPATLTGRIVVAYGGSPLGSRPLASVTGTAPGGRFGWAVEGLDKYGFPLYALRFIVGAPDANSGAGEVHGFEVGDPPASRLFVLHGVEEGERFGYALAYAGFTRGALGGPEFLVGAPEASVNGPASGRFAIFFLDAPGDTMPADGDAGLEGWRLGGSIGGGQDTNPNYFEPSDDAVIGAPGADPEGVADAGSSLVWADQTAFTYNGQASQTAFGSTVRMTTDITSTHLPDLAVGESNAVRVYRGPLIPHDPPAGSLFGEAAGDEFGAAISNAGDIHAGFTARDQFLIGAPQHAGVGRVYVYTDLSPPTGVQPSRDPDALSFGAARPNPSRGAFSLPVELPYRTGVRVTVLDMAGRRVATLHDGPLGPGRFALGWTPRGTDPAGLYWGVLEADGARLARRMVRLP